MAHRRVFGSIGIADNGHPRHRFRELKPVREQMADYQEARSGFMVKVRRIVLDVLKPHQPNGLEFASAIAAQVPGAGVKLTVTAVDEKTETVVIIIEGESLSYEVIHDVISSQGGSIHSIDEVEVQSGQAQAGDH
jgi:hypothetical protein